MPVTGRVKFFDRSKALISDGATITGQHIGVTPSENESTNNLLSFDRQNYFQTKTGTQNIGGTENPFYGISLLSLSFPTEITFNRFILVDTNIEAPNINLNTPNFAYDVDNDRVPIGSSKVTSLSLRTKETLKTIYLELGEPVTSESLSVNLTYLQPSQRYFARQIIVANELGTFQGFPTVSAYTEGNNEIMNRTSTGLRHITKQIPTIDSFRIRLHAHPIESDVTLTDKLFQMKESFTLWPCGGGYGSNHFIFDKDGWRLEDIFNVQTIGKKSHRWYKNFYKSGANTDINLVEVI